MLYIFTISSLLSIFLPTLDTTLKVHTICNFFAELSTLNTRKEVLLFSTPNREPFFHPRQSLHSYLSSTHKTFSSSMPSLKMTQEPQGKKLSQKEMLLRELQSRSKSLSEPQKQGVQKAASGKNSQPAPYMKPPESGVCLLLSELDASK
jgi:hypothetical protein